MELRVFLFWVFIIFGLINLIHIGLYVVGANIYDMKQFRRDARRPKVELAESPFVTVLIPAHNEKAGIIRCLESVYASTYQKMAIVVIDDASTDNTAELIQGFIDQHPAGTRVKTEERNGVMVRSYVRDFTKPVTLVNRIANGGKAAGLNFVLKRYVREGLVMTLDADSVLDPEAIANAAAYFRDQSVVGVAANVQIMDEFSALGLLQKFEHMIGYRSKKFYAITNSEFIIGGVASTYRYDVLSRVEFYDTDTWTEDIGLSMKIVSGGNRQQRITYAADVVARTEGVQSFKALLKQRYRWKMGSLQNLFKHKDLFGQNNAKFSRMLTLYRIPMAFFSEIMLMLQPFVMSYVVYLSIMGHTFGLMLGGYMTVTLYVLWTVWPDEHHTWQRKVQLSLQAPLTYFCFYIMDVVQVAAIFRCLFNFRQLTGKAQTTSTWVSPERAGVTA